MSQKKKKKKKKTTQKQLLANGCDLLLVVVGCELFPKTAAKALSETKAGGNDGLPGGGRRGSN